MCTIIASLAVTVLLGATVVESTPVGVTVTIGLGVMASVIAVWSLLAIDPVYDYLTLAIAGFALFLSPWAAGFAGDGAGWTAWVAGFVLTALGVTGYLRGERIDFTAEAERTPRRATATSTGNGGSSSFAEPVVDLKGEFDIEWVSHRLRRQ